MARAARLWSSRCAPLKPRDAALSFSSAICAPNQSSDWVTRRNTPGAQADSSKERRQVEIGVGSQILADLGVKDMVLLTTSPQHVYVGLEAFGLHVTGTRKIE